MVLLLLIHQYLISSDVEQSLINSMVIADIDNNGQVDALTDGLVARYLFGLVGDTLIDGAVAMAEISTPCRN